MQQAMAKTMTRSEQKRLAIIEAAKAEFIECGVQGTSMDKISARAEVSKRTVYNHFASKERLVTAILEQMWQQSMLDVEQPYQGDKPLAPQLVALLAAEVALFQNSDYLDLARVAMSHFFFHPEQLQQAMAEFDKSDNALHRWLAAAKEDGRLQLDSTDRAVNQLHTQMKGMFFWPALMNIEMCGSGLEAKWYIREAVAMFLQRYEC